MKRCSKHKYSRWTYKELAELAKLAGEPVKAIAERFGKSISSVRARLKDMNKCEPTPRLDRQIAKKSKCKITWSIVDEIRKKWASGLFTVKQLRRHYKFDVWAIIQNRTWKDVKYIRPKRK